MKKRKITKTKVDAALERQLLIGCITDGDFCRDVSRIYDPDFIDSQQVRTIVDWCIDYYAKYESPPGAHIQDILESKAEAMEEDALFLTKQVLVSVSGEFERSERFNSQYVLDLARTHFKTASLKALSARISANVSSGRIEDAEEAILEYNRVELPVSTGVDVMADKAAIKEAFTREDECLFKLPGAIGELMNDQLVREGFLALMGPEKRGKTWWLMEMGYRALMAKCNVAFFSVGDMSQNAMMRRLHVRAAGKSDRHKYCGTFDVPHLDCKSNQDNSCKKAERTCKVSIDSKDYKYCTWCQKKEPFDFKPSTVLEEMTVKEPLTWREAVRQGEKMSKRTNGRDIRLSTHPNSTVRVADIEQALQAWEVMDGWIADVVIIDYADIMAPEIKSEVFRHQMNSTWQALRSLSQKRRCLVVTATQTDAASYKQESIGTDNFSEDKRKFGHVRPTSNRPPVPPDRQSLPFELLREKVGRR
jgi:hypothetical protein